MLSRTVLFLTTVLLGVLTACGASDPDTQTETKLNSGDIILSEGVGGDDLSTSDSSGADTPLAELDGVTQSDGAGFDVVADVDQETVSGEDTTVDVLVADSLPSVDVMIPEDVRGVDMQADSMPFPCISAALVPPQATQAEPVTLITDDGKTLAGVVTYPIGAVCLPGLLLVHQFTLSKDQWGNRPEELAKSGFVVLTLDLRGHGESDPQNGALAELLSDPNQAPKDIAAAMKMLLAHPAVDPERVGVLGTSIGANLAVVAMVADMGAKVVVPISPRYSAIEDLSGETNFVLSHVLCLATELDSNGDQAKTCETLVSAATGVAEKHIYPGADHGITLLNNNGDVWPTIVSWLHNNL